MQFEIMKTATENSKPIWDTLVMIFGGLAVILQSAIGTETLIWAKIFSFVGIGIFGITRAYFWIRHNGYEDKQP